MCRPSQPSSSVDAGSDHCEQQRSPEEDDSARFDASRDPIARALLRVPRTSQGPELGGLATCQDDPRRRRQCFFDRVGLRAPPSRGRRDIVEKRWAPAMLGQNPAREVPTGSPGAVGAPACDSRVVERHALERAIVMRSRSLLQRGSHPGPNPTVYVPHSTRPRRREPRRVPRHSQPSSHPPATEVATRSNRRRDRRHPASLEELIQQTPPSAPILPENQAPRLAAAISPRPRTTIRPEAARVGRALSASIG